MLIARASISPRRRGGAGEGEELSAGRSGATIAKAADLSSPSPIRFVQQVRVPSPEDRREPSTEILLRPAAGEVSDHERPLEREVSAEPGGVARSESSCEFHGRPPFLHVPRWSRGTSRATGEAAIPLVAQQLFRRGSGSRGIRVGQSG